MKKFCLAFSAVLMSLFMAIGFVGCGEKTLDDTYNLTLSYSIIEYDTNNMTELGTPITNDVIECKKRYKLQFDFNFDDIKNEIGDEEIEMNMYVGLGEYDNEENQEHIIKDKHDTGILQFDHDGNGGYKSNFKLNKDSEFNFDKMFFLIGRDSLDIKDEINHSSIVVKMVSVPTENLVDPPKFLISGGLQYKIDLSVKKTNYDFSIKNLVEVVGEKYTNRTITIPDFCDEIVITYYDSMEKRKKFGTKNFNFIYMPESFVNKELKIVLKDIAIELLGKTRYSEWISTGGFDVGIEFTAKGNKNFNDTSFMISFKFEH